MQVPAFDDVCGHRIGAAMARSAGGRLTFSRLPATRPERDATHGEKEPWAFLGRFICAPHGVEILCGLAVAPVVLAAISLEDERHTGSVVTRQVCETLGAGGCFLRTAMV